MSHRRVLMDTLIATHNNYKTALNVKITCNDFTDYILPGTTSLDYFGVSEKEKTNSNPKQADRGKLVAISSNGEFVVNITCDDITEYYIQDGNANSNPKQVEPDNLVALSSNREFIVKITCDDIAKYYKKAIYDNKQENVKVPLLQRSFHPFLHSELLNGTGLSTSSIVKAKSLVFRLLLSDFNTNNGITLTADHPFGSKGLMNITRPAVLRTYYGKNIEAASASCYRRFSYGYDNSTVSSDPRKFATKPMNEDMYEIGKYLKTIASRHYHNLGYKCDILDYDYNHCTVLLYNHYCKNKNYKLNYHCDSAYNHKGKFMDHNCICENSAVLVYTLGDDRDIHFKKRNLTKHINRYVWVEDNTSLYSLTLQNDSLFILHPLDEKPMKRQSEDKISQIMHGNVRVKQGCMSIAFVFRVVTTSDIYDNITDFRILTHQHQSMNERFIPYDETILSFEKRKQEILSKFRNMAKEKMIKWNWC